MESKNGHHEHFKTSRPLVTFANELNREHFYINLRFKICGKLAIIFKDNKPYNFTRHANIFAKNFLSYLDFEMHIFNAVTKLIHINNHQPHF